jgi:hypothetical protein
VDPFLDELTGLAIAIRPGLAAAPATFRETQALFSEARPGLRAAASTLRTAGRAVDPTLALLLAVDPTLPNLENTLQHVTPILTSLGSYGCDFVRFGRQWGSMMAYGNQAGAELRFNLVSPGLDALAGFQSKVLPAELATPADAYPRPCTVGPGRGGQ